MKKRHKYNAKKTIVDGITFDSQKEATRWSELVLLEKADHIEALQRQYKIELVKGVKLDGETRARPAIRIVVDFVYWCNESQKIRYEDTKGFETPISRMKRHMALALHDIDVEVV